MRFLFLAAFAGSVLVLPGHAQNLLANGSFEEPVVEERAPGNADDTPDPASWAVFAASAETTNGRLRAGITKEIARTGKQSLFLDFEKVTAPARVAMLQTELVPIKPGNAYRVSLWGRIDRKRPLALDERRPYMTLEIRYYAADGTTETGEPIAGAQLIPGNVTPGSTPELAFRSGKWKESFAKITAPEAAGFLRVTWTWTTPVDEGETDGRIYWDDASVTAEAPAQQ